MNTALKAMIGVAVFAAGVAMAIALRPDAPVGTAAGDSSEMGTGQPIAATTAGWVVPDIETLPDDPWGRTVRQGRDLIAQTAAIIGPEVADPARRLSGNNLDCQSCHLQAGTQQFALPLVGVFADFPQYRGRSGRVNTIEDRVNGCMTRSMNGKPLANGGEDMVAIVAYLKFLSSGRPVGEPTEGRGSARLADIARAADPMRGKAVYARHCTVCHGADGAGQRAGQVGDAKGYSYPPLWGADSYNNGAGMGRVTTAAGFIRSNMPLGTSWRAPVLSEEQAFDVAAYINSQPRPQRAGLERDYPRLEEKPVDAPYGPYADGFSSEQHRFGPFGPMRKLATGGAKP